MSSDYQPQTSGKVWCSHIELIDRLYRLKQGNVYTALDGECIVCPKCQIPRPEETKDDLQTILRNYFDMDVDISRIEKDLRDWREQEVQKIAELSAKFYQDRPDFFTAKSDIVKEEKPKRLAQMLRICFNGGNASTDIWNEEWHQCAVIAIEAIEKIIDFNYFNPQGLRLSMTELKQKIRQELL